MKYLSVIIISLCLVASKSQAQTASDSTQKTTFIVAALYSSNANYYGQSAEEKLPYVLTNASVKFPGGLWLSASAYKLLNIGSGVSAADASVGLAFNLNKSQSFTGDVSYSHSFYPENSPLIQAANENSVSASLSYDWSWLNTSVSADYAFGKESDLFISFSNSKSIELGSFSERDFISLEPAIEIVGGTQHFYETYTTKKKLRDKLKDKIKNPFDPPGNDNTTTTTVTTSSFGLLSYNLKLPLAYNRTHYMIEVGYQLSILDEKVETVSNKPQSFFNLSFYYLF
jgi:hypothetical protein